MFTKQSLTLPQTLTQNCSPAFSLFQQTKPTPIQCLLPNICKTFEGNMSYFLNKENFNRKLAHVKFAALTLSGKQLLINVERS